MNSEGIQVKELYFSYLAILRKVANHAALLQSTASTSKKQVKSQHSVSDLVLFLVTKAVSCTHSAVRATLFSSCSLKRSLSLRKSTWVPSVRRFLRSFRTLCTGAEMKHLKPFQIQCTVEKWRYKSEAIVVRCSSLAVLVNTFVFSFRFCRSCSNTTCKRGTKYLSFLCQPRWEQRVSCGYLERSLWIATAVRL